MYNMNPRVSKTLQTFFYEIPYYDVMMSFETEFKFEFLNVELQAHSYTTPYLTMKVILKPIYN